METDPLNNPELYINRELSLLEFNRRVLAQAKDDSLPLLERLRFLCISSSVLDEFFEIRVAGLKQQERYGSVQRGPDNMLPAEQLSYIGVVAGELIDEQYRVLNEVLLPRLDLQGIRLLDPATLERQAASRGSSAISTMSWRRSSARLRSIRRILSPSL